MIASNYLETQQPQMLRRRSFHLLERTWLCTPLSMIMTTSSKSSLKSLSKKKSPAVSLQGQCSQTGNVRALTGFPSGNSLHRAVLVQSSVSLTLDYSCNLGRTFVTFGPGKSYSAATSYPLRTESNFGKHVPAHQYSVIPRKLLANG